MAAKPGAGAAGIKAAQALKQRRASKRVGWLALVLSAWPLLLGVLGGMLGLCAVWDHIPGPPPRQVCPREGATSEPCMKGEIAPYIADLDVDCFGSKQAKLSKTLKKRTGDASGKQVPLWLSVADAQVMKGAPCVLDLTRDFNCTMCPELNMTAAPEPIDDDDDGGE
jgi:hypothetical protein